MLIAAGPVLFFGAAKLPGLARSIGCSAKELRSAMHDDDEDDDSA